MPSVLTPAEALFLSLCGSGKTIPEIAAATYRSKRDVERTSTLVKRKLNAKNLPQAVLIAHKLGYVSLPDDNGEVTAQSPWTEGA